MLGDWQSATNTVGPDTSEMPQAELNRGAWKETGFWDLGFGGKAGVSPQALFHGNSGLGHSAWRDDRICSGAQPVPQMLCKQARKRERKRDGTCICLRDGDLYIRGRLRQL